MDITGDKARAAMRFNGLVLFITLQVGGVFKSLAIIPVIALHYPCKRGVASSWWGRVTQTVFRVTGYWYNSSSSEG